MGLCEGVILGTVGYIDADIGLDDDDDDGCNDGTAVDIVTEGQMMGESGIIDGLTKIIVGTRVVEGETDVGLVDGKGCTGGIGAEVPVGGSQGLAVGLSEIVGSTVGVVGEEDAAEGDSDTGPAE